MVRQAGTRRKPFVYLGAGVALAALLAVVLFAGVGSGGVRGVASTRQEVLAPDTAPGINASTGLLLSLTVLHQQQPAAPQFRLTDQYGHVVSPASFRGKVVVVSINDDRCQDLCTFYAADVVRANQDLGAAAKHVVWLSVNANPFYPAVSAVRTWTDEHGLGGQHNWYFTTGSPAALAKTWHAYGFYVQLDHKTRTVSHSTEQFFVDPAGHERAVGEFGAASASTALFAHGMAQMADDLLPASEQVHVAGPETPAPSGSNATVGAPAPPLALHYLQGGRGTFDLAGDRGRYTVVNFFASTCTVCRTELPALERAYHFARSKVDFVGVDVSDRASAARALLARTGVTYPVVSDPNGTASGAEQVTGLPYTVIVGPAGKIVIRHPGGFTTEQLEYLLEGDVPALAPPS